MSTTDDDFERLADEVHRADPGEFVAVRDRHVRELRSGDRRDLATRIAALRRPTLSAWAVNQLALRDRQVLDAVLRAGDAVREAQGKDDRSARQDTRRQLREYMAAARERASEHLERIGADPSGHLEEVEQTLTAAAVDPSERLAVLQGHLVKPLDPPGFEALTGLAMVAPARDEPGGVSATVDPAASLPDDDVATSTTRDDGAAAQREQHRELRREMQQLERRRSRAELAVERADERAERLRRQADEAADAAAESRREIEQIEERLSALREELSADGAAS